MAKQQWRQLDPRVRSAIVVAGVVDVSLRITALLDLRRRSQAAVRGSRTRWALALALVNSGGVLPVVYFTRGRR